MKTISEFSDNWFKNAKIVLKTYKNIDNESKEIIRETLNSLLKIGKSNIQIKRPKLRGETKTENQK